VQVPTDKLPAKKNRSETIRTLKKKAGISAGLVEYLREVALDEERILANLVFEPVVKGRQLVEHHFTVSDFQGNEANRLLIGALLDLLNDNVNINLSNLMYRLVNEKHGNKTLLDMVGGEERVRDLFLAH